MEFMADSLPTIVSTAKMAMTDSHTDFIEADLKSFLWTTVSYAFELVFFV